MPPPSRETRHFYPIRCMAFGQNEPKTHRHTIVVPRRHHQDEAQAQKPGMMLADTSFLRHRMLGAACVSVAAITKERQDTARWCWQGRHQILCQPAHEEMYIPIGGFEQAAKAPSGNGGWRPPGEFFQGLAPGRDGLHEDEPAEDETMAPAPHRWHTTKDQGHKARQRGEGDQHVQSPRQRRERKELPMEVLMSPLHLFSRFSSSLRFRVSILSNVSDLGVGRR